MKYAHHFCLANPEQRTARQGGRGRETKRVGGGYAVLPQEISRTHQGDRGFFSILGDDGYFHLALLYIKHRIGRIPLREGRFILFQAQNRPAQTSLREEGPSIENRSSISSLRLGRVRPRTVGNPVCGAD